MIRNHSLILIGGILSATIPMSANAALEPRLSGKAYYDTETNLTWAIPVEAKTISEQVEFVSNLVIDGIGDWKIPGSREFFTFTYSNSTCPDTFFGCPPHLPLPPLDAHLPEYGWSTYWVNLGPNLYPWITHYDGAVIVDEILYGAYRPTLLDSIPYIDLMTRASVWPVHTGDVALIPEPATYAMLLAGLGLMAFRRNRSVKLTSY